MYNKDIIMTVNNPALEVQRLWHPTLNLPLLFENVSNGSHKKCWWVCDKGHEYEATKPHVLSGRRCPICAGKKLFTGYNDVATLYPTVVNMWDTVLNPQNPQQTLGNKNKKVWVTSNKCTHSWETLLGNIVTNCPYCNGTRILIGFNDLYTLYPKQMEDWDTDRNKISPDFLTYGSAKKVFWKCSLSHQWEGAVNTKLKSSGNGCPVCLNRTVIPGINDLQTLNSKIAAEWHPTLNGSLNPDSVPSGSKTTTWWVCDKGHEYEAKIYDRTRTDGKKVNCPVCSNRTVIQGYNDATVTRPELVAIWHPTKNGSLKLHDFLATSGQELWWKCDKGHEWEQSIKKQRSSKPCVICNSLLVIHPEVAKEWHPTLNGSLTPGLVSFGSKQKVWWQCDKGHKWEATVDNRQRGAECPYCSRKEQTSKAEKTVSEWVKQKGHKTATNTRTIIPPYELDIYIPEKQIAIEFNGIYWHDEKHKSKTYHYDKWLACKKAGIQLIQIWEDDWNRNPNLILNMLSHKLNMSTEHKVFARKTTIVSPTPEEATVFLKENHIQGAVEGSIRVGLKYEGNLVALMVAKYEPGSNKKALNILRYVTSTTVTGGFTKIVNHIETTYHIDMLITFSDNTVSDGSLYQNNGFQVDSQISPDYMYVTNGVREHKFGYRLKRFKTDPGLKYVEGLTERELAELNGLNRIWDAGKTKWVKLNTQKDIG